MILRKQYIWGSGRIVFEKQGILITTWSRTGTYKFLDKNIVRACWSGYDHILVFNSDYTNFTSFLISNIGPGPHNLDNNLRVLTPAPSKLEPLTLVNSKNLLYFCVFHNSEYFYLLDILLITLRRLSNIDNIDFLVLTCPNFESNVKALSAKFNINISVHLCNFNTQHEAGCARLFIFDYPKINEYAKILYMDCDIVVQGDISKLFSLPIEEKVYAKKEYDIGGEGHGGWFFDFSVFDPKKDAINSGVLLFPNCTKIRSVFNDIRIHIDELRKTSTMLPLCMDQPFIIYHLVKNNVYDNELISPYIYLAEFTQPPIVNSYELILCHFVWPIGNITHKLHRMMQHKISLERIGFI